MRLNYKDWQKLYKNNLITALGINTWTNKEFKDLNGYVSTTKFADKMQISRSWSCNIWIGRSLYSVQYYSGCFYPLWTKGCSYKDSDIYYRLDNKTKSIYKIDVNN